MAAILTITSQLLDGTLAGPRVIYSGSRMCKMFVSPRDCVLDVVKGIPHQYGLYILLGKTETGGPKAYIGQTKDFQQRVRNHLANKDFWDKAIVFISKADEIYSSEVQYLEYLGIQKALEVGTYSLDENLQIPPEPGLAPEKKIEMEQFFEEIQFFLRFYGCNIFEKQGRKKRVVHTVPVPQPKQEDPEPAPIPTPTPPVQPSSDQPFREYYFAIRKVGMSAKMRYYPAQNKYVVLAGSQISAINASSLQPSIASFRDGLFAIPAKCVRKGDVYELLEDVEIPGGSASAAAKFCAGNSRNGKIDWVDAGGHTIGEYLDGKIS